MISQYGLSLAIIAVVALAGLLTWWILAQDKHE